MGVARLAMAANGNNTPAEASNPAAPTRIIPIPCTRWKWDIPPESLVNVVKGTKIESEGFELPPLEGNFKFHFYPKGIPKAKDGFCSAYLWAERNVTAQVRLSVNDDSRVIDGKGAVTWEANVFRGYAYFGPVPTGSVVVGVELIQAAVPVSSDVDFFPAWRTCQRFLPCGLWGQ